MNYRGPDNTSHKIYNNFTLVHNRLSIVDHNVESNQPFESYDGRYSLVFNGEIYNYREIRAQLSSKYPFKTDSDTEVLLYSYIEYGKECLNMFRGMFAFAIYDNQEDRLFCARDRLGIKPFVYYCLDAKLIFASEIKPILALLPQTPSVNKEALYQYLTYLYIPQPNTIFENIRKLPPAHYMLFENGKLEIKQYWSPEQFSGLNSEMDEHSIIERLDELLAEAVNLRMIADVELGAFLSGGLDSSTILYYMQKNSLKPINTFTLGFETMSRYDERKDAAKLAQLFGTANQEILIQPDITNLLPLMVRHFDEPFGNPTAILIYELTRHTKAHATVALAGDGGDELFSGYPRYQAVQLADKLRFLPKICTQGLQKATGFIPESSNGIHFFRRLKQFVGSLPHSPDQQYEEWVGYFQEEELNKLVINLTPFSRPVRDLWRQFENLDGITKASLVDLHTFLPGNLLQYGDAMSMANAFEVRFPLIDHKLVEFMASIPSQFRMKNGQKKYLLKALMKNRLPEEIINKPKLGLNPPMGHWLKTDLSFLIEDYLSSQSIKKRGLFHYQEVQNILSTHIAGKRDLSLQIWGLIVLEEWFRQYID